MRYWLFFRVSQRYLLNYTILRLGHLAPNKRGVLHRKSDDFWDFLTRMGQQCGDSGCRQYAINPS